MTRQPKPEFLNPDDFPEPHMESAFRVSEAERLALEIDGERYGDVAAELRRLAAENEQLAAYTGALNERCVSDAAEIGELRADRDSLAAEVERLRDELCLCCELKRGYQEQIGELAAEVEAAKNEAAENFLRAREWAERCGGVQAEVEALRAVQTRLLTALEVLVENGGIGPEQMFRNTRAAIDAANASAA